MDCEIYQASTKEHDEAVSLISHLPIFLASALINTAHTHNNQTLFRSYTKNLQLQDLQILRELAAEMNN